MVSGSGWRLCSTETLNPEGVFWQLQLRGGTNGSTILRSPVLDAQIRNFLKIFEIACEESGVVGEGDGGDFQVHGSNVQPLQPEILKYSDCYSIEWDNWSGAVVGQHASQLTILRFLPIRSASSGDFRKPATHLFLITDDGDGNLSSWERCKPLDDSPAFYTASRYQRDMIGIKQIHRLHTDLPP